ncbi:MAG: S41 family peptidase, partial [Solirubrobacterales bacterium]
GKGTFQEVIDLPDGGALDLTIGEYLTADGSSILGEGVQPDVRVADDPDTEGADEGLDRGLEVLGEELPPAQQ